MSAFEVRSACASVLTAMNSTPWIWPELIMELTNPALKYEFDKSGVSFYTPDRSGASLEHLLGLKEYKYFQYNYIITGDELAVLEQQPLLKWNLSNGGKFVVFPLAAITFALLALKRREPFWLSLICLGLGILFVLALAFNFFSLLDPAVLIPDSCTASTGLVCNEVVVSNVEQHLQLVVAFSSVSDTSLDLREAVGVASIEGVFEPGVCSFDHLEILQPGRSATVACDFGVVNGSFRGEKVRGQFGVDYRNHRLEPLRSALFFTSTVR